MQPTIRFRKNLDILISIASFFRKCSVGCIFNSVWLIITRELACIKKQVLKHEFRTSVRTVERQRQTTN
jgi:hypothetical protein